MPDLCTHGPDNNVVVTEQWRFIQYANGSRELYNRKEDPYEWNNLARQDGYEPIMEKLAGHLPESVPPATGKGNKTRLIEIIDGEHHWQGKKFEKNAKVPMEWMR